jgi:hypothetical protein
MPRPIKAKTRQDQKMYFRHLVDLETPLGKVYDEFGKTKEQKTLIGESLVNSLLPYAYKNQNPELAKEAAQLCIQKLLLWIQTLRIDFDLEDELSTKKLGELGNALFADRIIREFQQLRQAITQNAAVIHELQLIRESIGKIPGNGGVVPAGTSTPAPSNPSLRAEEVDIFTDGQFLDHLEEVL